jgi:hypothetical protein
MNKLIFTFAVLAVGCSDDVSSDEEARRAYLGLDESITKSLTLGFAGFNAAQSANIPAQMTTGIEGGTLAITGQVDQGNSNNKGMRLRIAMVGYTDGVVRIDGDDTEIDITYDTDADVTLQPYLQLQLKNIPSGTLDGTLTGDYAMKGDLEGKVTLNLTLSGPIQDDGTGKVIRVPGMTTVTGSATNSDDGVYEISLTL